MQTGRHLTWRTGLLAFLALNLQLACAVVTWDTIECAGVTIGGQSLNNIWDNAALLASNAESTITSLTSASIIKAVTTPANLANNAKWMFGISVNWGGVLPSSSKTTLTDTVTPVYNNAKALLQTNNGYLICGGQTAQQGTVGSFGNAWYYTLPGTEDILVLSGQPPNEQPCSPDASPPTLGQTFNGVVYPANSGLGATPTGNAIGILFCAALLESNGYKGTLALSFPATVPSADFPDPDQYRSASGTLLHEMIHATDTSKFQDQENTDLFNDGRAAYGFNRCGLLAEKSQSQALVNPDGYRIFAEMCMSSGTRWGAPTPPNVAAPPPSKKRSLGRDKPRLNIAQRRAAGALLGPPMSAVGSMPMNPAGHLGWSS